VTYENYLTIAVTMGLLSPFIIVGVGTVLGLTLGVTQFMLGMVMGMITLFHGKEDEE
jgi:hypothetical protein